MTTTEKLVGPGELARQIEREMARRVRERTPELERIADAIEEARGDRERWADLARNAETEQANDEARWHMTYASGKIAGLDRAWRIIETTDRLART